MPESSEIVIRKTSIDLLRIIAFFFVIFNHTEDRGFFLFSLYPSNSIQYWVYMFVSVFCKFSVPLFFAISGALLLPKEESIKDVWLNRVLKLCIVLLVFSFGCYLINIRNDLSQFSWYFFFGKLYQSYHNVSYWYLYAFIPYLIALPLLRPLARNMKNEHFLYMAIIGISFMAVLPISEYLLWHGEHSLNNNFRLRWITSSAVIFPCLGYYLENRMDINKAKKYIPILWLINIATIMVTCYITYYKATITGVCNEESSQTFHSSFVLINVITLYVTFKCLFNKPLSHKWTSLITSIGKATFGMYLIHITVRELVNNFHILDFLRNTMHINYMISSFIYCLIIFIIAYAITLIMKKIPLLKKLI